MIFLCPERKAQSHTPLHSASNGHEIQQQHQVSASPTSEAAVEVLNEGATILAACPQEQEVERQQPPQRQCEQQAVKPLRNDSPAQGFSNRKTYRNLFPKLCEYDNLLLAFIKARKRKTTKAYVQRFEMKLSQELIKLQWELLTGTYAPAPLTIFTVRDPKTRKISASHFRDRVVHHAICNLIEPIFESRFIYDTFANRKGKGTSGTLERFDIFLRRHKTGFALKADIRKYFETVDHQMLLSILGRRIKDERMLQIIRIILENHKSERPGKGMPLGNLTSQFFANIYLGELDYFVKHQLRAKSYLRYVDDFVIVHRSKKQLQEWQEKIDRFLSDELCIQLHAQKTQIVPLEGGVPLVGFRIFRHHKLLKKSNKRRLWERINRLKAGLKSGEITKEHIALSMSGWQGYAKMGNTYGLRQKVEREIASFEVGQ